MGLFVCNAYHYVFEADTLPDTCPRRHLESVLGSTDSGRKAALPAVRPTVKFDKWDKLVEVGLHRP